MDQYCPISRRHEKQSRTRFKTMPREGPGQPVSRLSKLLEQGGPQCHIPETLIMEAPEHARPLLTKSMKHGPWPMDTSHKPQASSAKLRKIQAASVKPQAASLKLQAASDKLYNFFALIKFHATRSEVLR